MIFACIIAEKEIFNHSSWPFWHFWDILGSDGFLSLLLIRNKDVDPSPTVKNFLAQNPDTTIDKKMWARNFIFYNMFKFFLVANHLFNAIFPEQSCINAEKKPKIMMIMLLFGNVGSGYYTKCIRDGWFWFGDGTKNNIKQINSILLFWIGTILL